MSYVTLPAIKQHLGISSTTDDPYLLTLIGAARDIIDHHCGRWFEARVGGRRYGPEHIVNGKLRLDADLLDVSTLRNGDGQVISQSNFVLLPRNAEPKSAVGLRGGVYWFFDRTAGEDGEVFVVGDWGYCPEPLPSIVQAATELVADLYHGEDRRNAALEKGAQAFSLARELPPRVLALIEPFVRRSV